MKVSPLRFAQSPEGKIAYREMGEGPLDLLLTVPAGWNVDLIWDYPPLERYLRRLASFARVIVYNARGTGPSDPISLGAPPSFEEWTMDLRWVMDAAGSERSAFLAIQDTGAPLLMFAASFPERTQAIVLLDCYSRLLRDDGYPWGFPLYALELSDAFYLEGYGTGRVLQVQAPELADDERFVEWFARLERNTISPSTLSYIRRLLKTIDVRGVLSSIKAPTLVVSHTGDPYIRPGHGRYLAEHIEGARYVEREGHFGLFFLHDVEWTLDEVQTFLTGTRSPEPDDRVLATVLFTDIVGSTERAAELGDARWRALLDEHDVLVRREIERFRGHLVKTTGDGVLATFDGPARAIRCAVAIDDAVSGLGIRVRSGLHTGEVELRGEDVGGIAVHIGARVMAESQPGEVLVSGSIPPLVAGSGLEFEDRGERVLKGIPGSWRLATVRRPAVAI